MTHIIHAARHGIVYIVGAIAAMVAAHCSAGCYPAKSADEAYRQELLQCVELSKTAAESKDCRRKVNEKYNVCEGVWPQYRPCQ